MVLLFNHQNSEYMSGIELVCDVCSKKIPFGSGYVCINHNIENYDKDPITLNNTVNVISSEQVFTACGKCGNRRSAAFVKAVLKLTLKPKSPSLN